MQTARLTAIVLALMDTTLARIVSIAIIVAVAITVAFATIIMIALIAGIAAIAAVVIVPPIAAVVRLKWQFADSAKIAGATNVGNIRILKEALLYEKILFPY